MRKIPLTLLILILLGSTARGQVQVFYLPESGFMRVEGQIKIEPSQTSLSCVMFPGAQITEFWADEMAEYQIEPGPRGTMVAFRIYKPGLQTLTFSYEGFLDPKTTQVTLGRDNLWFPEFGFPIKAPLITMELPAGWELMFEHSLEKSAEKTFRVSGYPIVTVTNTNITWSEKLPFPQDNKPSANEILAQEYLSKTQMQVTRLTTAMSHRHETEIRTLLGVELLEKGLAQYLASLPRYYGGVTSEFLTKPSRGHDEFQVRFSTEKGPQFLASMVWQEKDAGIKLEKFRLTPYGFQVPDELFASLEVFLRHLEWVVQAKNQVQLKALIADNLDQDHLVEFFISLGVLTPWSIQYTALEPFGITVFVPHSRDLKLLLNIGLIPGEQNWLIHSLEVIPWG